MGKIRMQLLNNCLTRPVPSFLTSSSLEDEEDVLSRLPRPLLLVQDRAGVCVELAYVAIMRISNISNQILSGSNGSMRKEEEIFLVCLLFRTRPCLCWIGVFCKNNFESFKITFCKAPYYI